MVIFTDKRLIIGDKQGLMTTKFATETAGNFELDKEIKIWISGRVEPSEVLQFKKVKIYQMFNACLQKRFCNFKYGVLI